MSNYGRGLEPVRLIGWFTTAVVLIGSIVKQVADVYDEGTGWLGLGFAVVMAISTELQRSRVTPVAKLGGPYISTEG
jgi:hypothetical protein